MVGAQLALGLGSCSLMHDDLPECATQPDTQTRVKFVYDYNTRGENLFPELVGAVTLYVFDQDGKLIREIESTAASADLSDPAFAVNLDIAPGKYKLYAVATDNPDGYEAELLTEGAKFRRGQLLAGDLIDAYSISLDHNSGLVEHQNHMLPMLWTTHTAQDLTVTEAPIPAEGDPQPEDVLIEAVVPLIRVTNLVHLSILRDTDRPRPRTDLTRAIANPDGYEVQIVTATGRDRIDILANPLTDATPLVYTPHAKGVGTDEDGREVVTAEIGTSRFIIPDDPANADRLRIFVKRTGEVFEFPLEDMLVKAKSLYEGQTWSDQEFLDREYEYSIKVTLNELEDEWKYIDISVGQHSWVVRIQNVDL